MAAKKFCHILSFYLWATIAFFQNFLSLSLNFVIVVDMFLALYFRFCGLSPCKVNLNDQTTIHFWTSNNHVPFNNKPNLVLVHGYAGNSRWQFINQVGTLSRSFNLHLPDLLFFGKSSTNQPERTDTFQAKCVVEGLKRLGVVRFAVYGISYGGYVAYWMAEMYPKMVEKVVIVSCGIALGDFQKREHLSKIGKDPLKLLVPESPHDLRLLVNLSAYNCGIFKWVPDYFFSQFINAMYKEHKKEKLEMAEHLLSQKAEPNNLPVLTQETLIIWGDKDKVFPLNSAYQLQRHLGHKAKVKILKDTGHAANIDASDSLNALISSFVLG